VNYINNNYYYNPPTDSPTESHEPMQHPEESCEQCKTLQKKNETLQKQCETRGLLLVGVLLVLVPSIVQWNFSGVKQCLQLLCKLICLI
jgi:hypothetical protein